MCFICVGKITPESRTFISCCTDVRNKLTCVQALLHCDATKQASVVQVMKPQTLPDRWREKRNHILSVTKISEIMYKDLAFVWSSLSLNLICTARKMTQGFLFAFSLLHANCVCVCVCVCMYVCICVCVSYLILKETEETFHSGKILLPRRHPAFSLLHWWGECKKECSLVSYIDCGEWKAQTD